jgi:hypothetical protein
LSLLGDNPNAIGLDDFSFRNTSIKSLHPSGKLTFRVE